MTAAGLDAKTLADIEQIKQLKARYFRFMDSKKWTDWRACFTDDMHFYRDQDPNPIDSSGDAFVSRVSKHLERAVTVHQGHMPEIEITGPTTAHGVWAMFDWVNKPEENRQGYGHYIEDYEKGPDGRWRIKSLRLTRIRVDSIKGK